MMMIYNPDLLIWISSLVDFVVEVAIVRPLRSMILYLVSAADSINKVWLYDHTFIFGVSLTTEIGVGGL